MTVRDFHALRSHLGLPPADETDRFPAEVLAEAEQVASRGPQASVDRTEVPFVTIDPPGSMDLDQAVHLERTADGFVVHYAIADVGGAVQLGGAIDDEARRRGQTVYLPDGRVPLHPPVLSEGALSLLPDVVRAAVVWTVAVRADGEIGDVALERALVRSVARLDYEGVQQSFDDGTPHASIEALRDLGTVRREARLAAGAIDLALPSQHVVPAGDGWNVALEPRTAADGWNAEVSLLTGMAAARLMVDGRVGLLRTLPGPPRGEIERFEELAQRLGVEVPAGAGPGRVLAGLDLTEPRSLALMTQATRLLRGAGYAAFDEEVPDVTTHAGIGGAYAQVTAPLRRLADRFSTQVCLALAAGERPDQALRAALDPVADAMAASDRVAAEADRTAIDQVETWVMQDRTTDVFDAVVLRAATDQRPAEVMVVDPPVVSEAHGDGLDAGAQVRVRVARVDAAERRVTYVTQA